MNEPINLSRTPMADYLRQIIPRGTEIYLSMTDAMEATDDLMWAQRKYIARDVIQTKFLAKLEKHQNPLRKIILRTMV